MCKDVVKIKLIWRCEKSASKCCHVKTLTGNQELSRLGANLNIVVIIDKFIKLPWLSLPDNLRVPNFLYRLHNNRRREHKLVKCRLLWTVANNRRHQCWFLLKFRMFHWINKQNYRIKITRIRCIGHLTNPQEKITTLEHFRVGWRQNPHERIVQGRQKDSVVVITNRGPYSNIWIQANFGDKQAKTGRHVIGHKFYD